jgi:hypothetical protein
MNGDELFTHICKEVERANCDQFKGVTLCRLHWLRDVNFYQGIPKIPCIFSTIEDNLKSNISKYIYIVQQGPYTNWTVRATYHWVPAYVGLLIVPYKQMEIELVRCTSWFG